MHNEVDAVPEATDVGATEFVVGPELVLHFETVVVVFLKDGAAAVGFQQLVSASAECPAMARAKPRLTGSKYEPSARARWIWWPKGAPTAGSGVNAAGGGGGLDEAADGVATLGTISRS